MQNVKKTNINTSASSHSFFYARLGFIALFVWVLSLSATSQNSKNTAFKSGETLQYDLYYNWKFVWVKAGTASMNITSTIWKGEPAYRTRMLTRGTSQADHFFVLRDTLLSIVTEEDMLPRYYEKTDMEKTSYRQRKVWYTYSDGKSHARQQYINPDNEVTWHDESDNLCIFDMLSILLRARSFDATDYKPGHKIKFTMTDGNGISTQTLIFRGRKQLKMHGGTAVYNCLVLSFVEYEKGKENEVVTFYVTDDMNHIPVRLDMYLNIGTAKAYLVGSKNVRNPMTARVRQ